MEKTDFITYVNGAVIRRVWTLEMIQAEMRRLDAITGLHGADIPCEFRRGFSCTLGLFHPGNRINGESEMKFSFSLSHFSDVTNPGSETSKLDIVRHEYAHYYAWVKYGDGGHGKYWKKACGIVGCNPSRFENRETMCTNEKLNAPYQPTIKVGAVIYHPTYGLGKVKEIECFPHTAVLTVEFEDLSSRRIDERWLLINGLIDE